VRDLLNRSFGGEAAPLMMHLAETSGLDEADLKRLRKLLESNKEKR
jgi:predicted transcriptional regulator